MQFNPRQLIGDDESHALLQTMDGSKWANAFCRATGFPDEGWALAWFCNAIMAAHDIVKRRVETPTDPPATPAGTYESSSAIPAMLPDSGSGSATGEAAASVPNAVDSGQPAQTGTDAGVAELIEQLRKHCKCYATMPDVCLPCEAGTALAQQATQLQDWRSWAQFVYLGGGAVTVADKALRSAVCAKHDEDVTSLRAELETAQQAREREKR